MPYNNLRKGRSSLARHTYFITTVTHRRQPWFRDWKIGRLVSHEMARMQDCNMAHSLAWVIMPDHLHWLVTLPEQTTLASTLKHLKAVSALNINRQLGRSGPIWQREYYDHALRSEEDLRALARYIVANPLRSGLVRSIGDYPLWDAAWIPEQDL